MAGAFHPAGHIGVQTFDPVSKAQSLEEIQGTVDRRRFGRLPIVPIGGDQVIGLHRSIGFQQELKHPAAGGRQAFSGPLALVDCGGDGVCQGDAFKPRMRAFGVVAIDSHADQLIISQFRRNRLDV